MTKVRITLKALTLAIFMLAFSALANAQATRTWVSGVGDDVNPCSRTAPCKTFAGAISKTFINGEIDTLDPGGFGTLTITKSITVDGTGTFASVLASGAPAGFTINIAANVNDPLRSVTLRGLSINGAGASGAIGTRTGTNGINVSSNGASSVFIEDCVVFHFASNGYNQVNTTSATNVYIRNTVFRDNGGDGIKTEANNAAFPIKVTLYNVNLTGNANGLHARSGSRVVARDCVFSGNTTNGIFSDANNSDFASVSVWSSEIALNGGNGVRAGNPGNLGGSGVTIAQNQIDRNVSNGVLISTSGAVETFSNNSIRGNGTDGCTGCTPVGPGS
ncbi:MAG: hypothetical protein QOF61_746 [Acidobacteriota bacterium]|jgi:hypothetical protein|nr:hypothetical protein [Acidobacteriota bacterium]